ncbi:hypothetical protein M501DRAFT_432751 [Patellaria atrata CBS 101060]|uniref:Uncharacterized protein n=1 Tax=Patellaria atrata CBS 101060 TaxID=1346257 RepID=A0A9P4VN97_9PEZI|nr:hypothetical protein M501DRAFT_432751 [Patellaria atrata CBS 101060]
MSKNQLLSTYKELGLLYSLCQWISYFLTHGKMQLIFNCERQEMHSINISIP